MKLKITDDEINYAIEPSLKFFLLRKTDTMTLYCKRTKNRIFWSKVVKELNQIFQKEEKEYLKLYYFIDSLFITRNKEMIESFKKQTDKFLKNEMKMTKRERWTEIMRIFGNFLKMPECCIDKYIKDNKLVKKGELEGIRPAKRFLKQLRNLKIRKNIFAVKILKGYIDYSLFIPCHPKCPRALKILKNYNKKD